MSTGIGERRYPCRRCGGPLTWSPARRTLACQACGAALPPDAPGTSPAAVIDHPLDVCLHAEAYPAQHGDDNDMRCTSCRGIARFARGVAATNCPYCGSPDIVACDAPHDRQGPENIVPFLVDAAEARNAVARWIHRAWLAPAKVARMARSGILRPMYLPFWMFDAHAMGHWDTGGGIRGISEIDFEDLPVCSVAEVDPALLECLEPFPAKSLRRYDSRYVAGFMALRSERTLVEATTLAHARVERVIAAAARRNRAAKDRDKLRVSKVEYTRETCKETLLPVWLMDYEYLGRPFRIAVNGATGVAAGDTPKSVVKVALLALAACWLIALIADHATALALPARIAQALWWTLRRPFDG